VTRVSPVEVHLLLPVPWPADSQADSALQVR
jgi:hypothetical protein